MSSQADTPQGIFSPPTPQLWIKKGKLIDYSRQFHGTRALASMSGLPVNKPRNCAKLVQGDSRELGALVEDLIPNLRANFTRATCEYRLGWGREVRKVFYDTHITRSAG